MNIPSRVAVRLLSAIEERRLTAAALEEHLTRQPGPARAEHREIDPIERRARIWRAHDATARALEQRWAKAMRKLFTRQQKAVLSRLEGNRGRRALADGTPNVDELFDRQFWNSETIDDVEALYELVAAAGFARISQQFGINFDLDAPYAQEFIDARANQLAGQVTETTYQAIKDTLSEGAAAGESIPDLAVRVRDVFDVASTARSQMIARTEVISAYNGSASLAAAQLPDDVVGGQEWISTSDGRTREDHADADGQTVGVGEAFTVGGEQLAYPGDPSASPDNVINCRCTIGLLTPEQMPGAQPSTTAGRPNDPLLKDALEEMRKWLPGRDFDELAFRRGLRSQETAA